MNDFTRAAAGYGAGQQNAPIATRAPVHAVHDELESNITQLHEVIGVLAERLGSVLGPSKPQSVSNEKGPQAAPTIANRIYSSSGAVRAARERVGDLLDRLEI